MQAEDEPLARLVGIGAIHLACCEVDGPLSFASGSRTSVPFARFSAAALLMLVVLATTSRLRATPAEDVRVAVYAAPQLPMATTEDGLRILLNLQLCVGEYCTEPEEIHLARTRAGFIG